jgi:hypothetical protein
MLHIQLGFAEGRDRNVPFPQVATTEAPLALLRRARDWSRGPVDRPESHCLGFVGPGPGRGWLGN